LILLDEHRLSCRSNWIRTSDLVNCLLRREYVWPCLFAARVTRTSRALNLTSRTLAAQIDLPNPTWEAFDDTEAVIDGDLSQVSDGQPVQVDQGNEQT
jgi:hypothetical protein